MNVIHAIMRIETEVDFYLLISKIKIESKV